MKDFLFLQAFEAFDSHIRTKKNKQDYRKELMNLSSYLDKEYFTVTVDDCKKYFKHLESLELKSSTIALRLSIHKSFYTFAQEMEFIEPTGTNPFHLVEGHYPDSRLKNLISLTQMDELLELAKTDPLVYVAAALTFRCAFRTSDIATITSHSIFYTGNGYGIELKDKRRIALPDDVVALLSQYRDMYTSSQQAIFLNHRGKPLTSRDLQRRIKSVFMQSQAASLQSIRNTSIVSMLQQGVPQSVISEYIKVHPNWMFRYEQAKEIDTPILKNIFYQVPGPFPCPSWIRMLTTELLIGEEIVHIPFNIPLYEESTHENQNSNEI